MSVVRLLHRLIAGSDGFSLLEVIVATSILSLAVGLVGTSVFQVLSGAQYWQEDAAAIKELRHAGSWLAGDVLNAKATDLVDGASPVESVMLTMFTGDEITYSVSENNLLRTHDDGVASSQITLASPVVAVSFALDEDDLTFSLEMTADQSNTETITLSTHLR